MKEDSVLKKRSSAVVAAILGTVVSHNKKLREYAKKGKKPPEGIEYTLDLVEMLRPILTAYLLFEANLMEKAELGDAGDGRGIELVRAICEKTRDEVAANLSKELSKAFSLEGLEKLEAKLAVQLKELHKELSK